MTERIDEITELARKFYLEILITKFKGDEIALTLATLLAQSDAYLFADGTLVELVYKMARDLAPTLVKKIPFK